MLKKFQDYLLLHYPLLWNTRLPIVLITALFFHIIFFAVGYADGAIDFTAGDTDYVYDIVPGIVVFFNILLSALIFIVWLVFYFRNNPFKSFYPLKNSSLYKEWLLLFLICIANCTYSASYLYAKDARARSYFSRDEAFSRIETISMASYFADGEYVEPNFKNIEKGGQFVTVKIDSFTYRDKKYGIMSLMNKSVSRFYNTDNPAKDSLNNIRIKISLYKNQKDSVLQLMQRLDKIAESHNLKGNISPQQWLDLVYDYPDFARYKVVGKTQRYLNNVQYDNYAGYTNPEYSTEMIEPAAAPVQLNDTINNTIKIINNQEYVFPKYYVPLMQLKESYATIAKAYIHPELDTNLFFVYIYFALACSLLIFSFRVTSGKSWLIAGVTLGITAMLSGIFSLIVSSAMMYYIFWVVVTVIITIHFIGICMSQKVKGYTRVTLNIVLWLMPLLLPLIFYSIKYYYEIYEFEIVTSENIVAKKHHWITTWENYIMYINLAFILLYMHFLTVQINKWKGIAEG